VWSEKTRGKEKKLVTFVEEDKGVAASILEKATWVREGGTNAARWTWQSGKSCQLFQIRLAGSDFGND